jgi:hypothetical protein
MAITKTARKTKPMKGKGAPIYMASVKTDALPPNDWWLGYEGGNGKAGLAYIDGESKIHTTILPNARVRVSGGKLEGYGGQVVKVPYATFGGIHWGYSDAIWNLTDRQIDAFQGAEERYGSPEHVFPLLVMMALNNLPDGAYKLVVTVPPGYYNGVKDAVVDGFQRGNVAVRGKPSGVWEIALDSDKTPRRYSFSAVFPVMEAADAAATAAQMGFNGQPILTKGRDGQNLMSGRVTMIDLGFVTADTPVLVNGALLEDSIATSSDSRGGILSNIAEPIIDAVIATIPGAAKWITPAHADYWLRQWATGSGAGAKAWSEEAGQVSIMGKVLHLSSEFERYSEAYSRYALRKVIAAMNESSDTAFAVGGGWLYTLQYVERWYKETKPAMQFVSHLDFPHLKPFSFIDINLVGLMTIAGLLAEQGY